tara:strand:- start:6023 stop:7732 length:1710 start_codon:yes stop_codon:yes gene_type:complete
MDTVNNLLEGASPYQVLQNQSAKLANKWGKSGLLEGISSSTEANNMAMLLENQAKQLVNEANGTGTGASFSGGNSEAWAGVALPLVRRVFGEIVAKDLVSVQPMNLPAGLIFYLDFQYGSDNGTQSAGDSLYSATADLKKTDLPTAGTSKGLYGAGTYGYSITTSSVDLYVSGAAALDATDLRATVPVAIGGVSGSFGFLDTSVASSASLGNDSEFLTAVPAANVDQFIFSTGSFTDPDLEAVRLWSLKGTGITANYNQFNNYDAANGTVELYANNGTLANDGTVTVTFVKGPNNLDDVGDFEEGKNGTSAGSNGSVSNLAIPEINVQLRSDTVAAKTRKLKAQWTPEFAQDLNAYHSIDAEAELTSILSEYISMEIDLEILDMLIQNADTTDFWSAKIAREVSSAGIDDDQTSGVYYTKMSWFQTLGVKLQKVSNLIHQKTLRGGANFMVVSPKVSTVLESIPGFAADSAGDQNKYAMGVQKVGAINSRYTVYKNPYMTENVILMGYKGSQFLETGAVFAPYIPLIMTPLVYDPVSFTPKKGIMTRYAKKMVRPDFYGKIIVKDLGLI